ncbi:MAG: 4Fe-4S double cluster binding domain-containing protein [Eubacteriales bacterium]|nr:4Fe-4S double cluster binding domain-containing protein [Eubacteriales bacterium]MDD3880726.1 4Fe-4S double cluster binding domain-containing protein [Eubacteriales bacterium]MDD4511640.1 4Fe-4S double cluster binding domain-containing protein [Eubacteriales bacterium]
MNNAEILKRLENKGYIAALLPVSFVGAAKVEVERLKAENELNKHQTAVVSRYSFEMPDSFAALSVLLLFAPTARVKLSFTQKGRTSFVDMGLGYDDYVFAPKAADAAVADVLGSGARFEAHNNFPMKILAALSGKCEYGRNNILYMKESLGTKPDFGCCFHIYAYYTELAADESAPAKIGRMERCDSCGRCEKACPTGAIMAKTAIINTERCITRYNEYGSRPLPEFITDGAQNALYGCNRCQLACPRNARLSAPQRVVDFSESETAALLGSADFSALPYTLRLKLSELDMADYLEPIRRNLPALLRQSK